MILTKWPGVTREISTFFVKAYINPEVPIGSLNKIKPNKCQPIRSSRLAGYRQHMYECPVLLYR